MILSELIFHPILLASISAGGWKGSENVEGVKWESGENGYWTRSHYPLEQNSAGFTRVRRCFAIIVI